MTISFEYKFVYPAWDIFVKLIVLKVTPQVYLNPNDAVKMMSIRSEFSIKNVKSYFETISI